MKNFWNKFKCLAIGHPCAPTGRKGWVLIEWKCSRCGKILVSHVNHPDCMVIGDEASDRIFNDRMKHLDTTPDKW